MPKSRAIRRLHDEGGVKRAPVLSKREFKRLLYVASDTRNPQRNRLIVWLLFAAGCGVTEIAQLEIQHVLTKEGSLRKKVTLPAKYSKNGKAGTLLFFNQNLHKALDDYLEYRLKKRLILGDDDSYRGLRKTSKLVLSELKRPYSLKKKIRKKKDGTVVEHLACDVLQGMIQTWGREAGIGDFSTHSGRRTLATEMSALGATEEMLCIALRHSSSEMPYKYIDSGEAELERFLEGMYSQLCDEVSDGSV